MTDDPSRPVRPAGPTRVALILIVVGIVVFLLAAGAIVGYTVLGRGGSGGDFDTVDASSGPSTVTVTSAPTQSPPGSSEPPRSSSTGTPTSTTPSRASASRPTVAGAPKGSSPCPVLYPPYQLYRASSVGSAVTTCGFAERVRKAYADSGRPGQLPRPVYARSPETGERIRMMCAARADIVTCTGGDEAVVYIY